MHGIEARDITAPELPNDSSEQTFRFFVCQVLGKMLHELRENRLRFPHDKKIHKGGQGLGVDKGGNTASDDQGLTRAKPARVYAPLFGERLDASGRKQGQEIEEVLFKAERTEKDRKITEGTARFQRNRGLAFLIKKTLTNETREAVYQSIDKLEPQVGIAQSIPVWKDKGNRQQPFPFLPLRPFFAGKEITGYRLALAHGLHFERAREEGSALAVVDSGQPLPIRFLLAVQQ
jgi:hypothetical protein